MFDIDDEVVAALTGFASEQKLSASHFTGLGALRNATLGYFDWDEKAYKHNPVEEQVEILSSTGFITESPQGPKVHCHVALGRADGAALGGQLLQGWVRPALELVLSESPRTPRRREDPETGLPRIDLDASS